MAGRRVLLVTHGVAIWCCRYVLEWWTCAEAERRFETEHVPNCSVRPYELEGSRLVLRDAGVVHWTTEPSAGIGGK